MATMPEKQSKNISVKNDAYVSNHVMTSKDTGVTGEARKKYGRNMAKVMLQRSSKKVKGE